MKLPPILNDSLPFVEESEAEALGRYQGFGMQLHFELFRLNPESRNCFRYFRNGDTEDLWSIYKVESFEFGLQLDPDTCCVCIWDGEWHDEIGDWLDDPIAFAIGVINERYFS